MNLPPEIEKMRDELCAEECTAGANEEGAFIDGFNRAAEIFLKREDDLKERYELACDSDNAYRELSDKLQAQLSVAIEALEKIVITYEIDCVPAKSWFQARYCEAQKLARETLSQLKSGESK